MFGLGWVELTIVALVLGTPLVVIVLLSVLVVRGSRASTPTAAVEVGHEWRLVQLTRCVGVVLGGWLAWLVWESGSWGRGPMLAPAVFGLVLLLAATVGETVVRPHRPAGPRTASLATRRVRDYLPPLLAPAVAAMVVVSGATLLLTTATASRDDHTRSMRSLSCTGDGFGSSRSPYPGSYYSAPLAGLLVAVLLVAVAAAVVVVRRPRGMASTDAGDDSLRRRSLDVVVCATGLAVCAPHVGVGLVAGSALRQLSTARPSCAGAWTGPVGALLLVSALAALVVGLLCAARLVYGSPRGIPVSHEPAAPGPWTDPRTSR